MTYSRCLSHQHIPERDPWLSEWCRLDTWHQLALRNMDADRPPETWRCAPHLADKKYKLWEQSVMYERIMFAATAGDM